MDITILIGGIFIATLLISSIGIDSFVLLFVNVDALILVFGCTFAATLIHFPITQVLRIWHRVKVLFSFKKYNYKIDKNCINYIADMFEGNMVSASQTLIKIDLMLGDKREVDQNFLNKIIMTSIFFLFFWSSIKFSILIWLITFS